jgi:hypothetical protein
MSVEIYVMSGCGLRSTAKIIKYLNSILGWEMAETPSYTSIKNWVEKSGYSLYKEPELKAYTGDYAQIVDESMMIGSEKMFLSLGIKAEKTGDSALSVNDVEILDISVQGSWNGKKIADVFSKTEKKMGRKSAYIISDNASTITKAVRDTFHIHIRDLSHTIAILVERQYKNAASFQAFTKDIAGVKFREVMRPTSYLLPPKQRTVARFMNLSTSIDWAKKVLKSRHRFTNEEASVFGFLDRHIPIITELDELFERINPILQRLKNKGMSLKTIEVSVKELKLLTVSLSPRVVLVGKACIKYLEEEGNKLTGKKTVWNASSDVIESLFGNYKSRKSPNPLNGVTGYVMILPLLTRIDTETGKSSICFKSALETVFLKDLKQWKEDNLTENLTVKRRKLLNVA